MSERKLIEDVTVNILRSLGLTKNVCETLVKDIRRLNLQEQRKADHDESLSPSGPHSERPTIE